MKRLACFMSCAAVCLGAFAAVPLPHDVARFGATDEVTLAVPTADAEAISFRLEAAGRFRFGEKRTWRRLEN